MPSTYAHRRFGAHVLQKLPAPAADIIRAHRELYRIGLHGPDILFYYHAIIPNPVTAQGHAMHNEPFRSFLEKAEQIWRQNGCREDALAYLFGFICHFALDSQCHGYIDRQIEASGVDHTEMEVEFDRMLLVKDGKDPLRTPLTGHIVPSTKNGRIIRPFYEDVTAEQIRDALKEMKLYDRLFLAPGYGKRALIRSVLFLSGKYKNLHGLLVNRRPNPLCRESNAELYRRYQAALSVAAELIQNYHAHLNDPSIPLAQRFACTFCGMEEDGISLRSGGTVTK